MRASATNHNPILRITTIAALCLQLTFVIPAKAGIHSCPATTHLAPVREVERVLFQRRWIERAIVLVRELLSEDNKRMLERPGGLRHSCRMHTLFLVYVLNRMDIRCNICVLDMGNHVCAKIDDTIYADAYPEGCSFSIYCGSQEGYVLYPADPFYHKYRESEEGVISEDSLRYGIIELVTIKEIYHDRIVTFLQEFTDVQRENTFTPPISGRADAWLSRLIYLLFRCP